MLNVKLDLKQQHRGRKSNTKWYKDNETNLNNAN